MLGREIAGEREGYYRWTFRSQVTEVTRDILIASDRK